MPMVQQIPSEQDWGDYKNDLDQEYAHRIFFGKSLEEVGPVFEHGVIERVDELRFMPLIPFRYYVRALSNYVMSKQILANEDSPDTASCFLNLVTEKLREAPDFILPVIEDLMAAVEYVAANQTLFDADVSIYGDFTEKLAEIKILSKSKIEGRQ